MTFQKAFVTGASSGIGEALAKLFAEKGISLTIHGRDALKLEALADELRTLVPVETILGDLTKSEDRAKLIEAIHHGVPDLLVNNAGMGLYGEALSYSTQEQMGMFKLNSEAVLELTLEGARTLASHRKDGVILNVSSVVGFIPIPYVAIYSASKAFVTHFSESLDEELRLRGIRVLTSCPGVVRTNFQKRAMQGGAKLSRQAAVMTPEYAAEQIWKQIESGKSVRTFDWIYRLISFLVRYVVPRAWLFSTLRKQFIKYLPQRPIVPI